MLRGSTCGPTIEFQACVTYFPREFLKNTLVFCMKYFNNRRVYTLIARLLSPEVIFLASVNQRARGYNFFLQMLQRMLCSLYTNVCTQVNRNLILICIAGHVFECTAYNLNSYKCCLTNCNYLQLLYLFVIILGAINTFRSNVCHPRTLFLLAVLYYSQFSTALLFTSLQQTHSA